MAGTKTSTLPISQNVNGPVSVQFANSDGACGAGLTTTPSNTKLLYTAGGNDSHMSMVIACTDSTANLVLNIYGSPDSGTTKYLLTSIQIPLTAGNTGIIPNVDILGSPYFPGLDSNQGGKLVLKMVGGYRIYTGLQVAVASGKFVNVTATGEDM